MRSMKTPEADLKPSSPEWLKLVKESVSDLRFGVVQIVVHDSKVVQIDKTEKHRLDPNH